MNPTTLTALRIAHRRMQSLIEELYTAAQIALDNDDLPDASLLQSIADKLYLEAENLDILISELEG
ncbi:MAG: hypothetical protein HWQ35_19130 [Nostoc sp. NMS1]|uniref:hypothetical protein n=1 Tax=unclassified Nostoc TaxID=2593658 RepID=UPI0025D784B2|nr:MULTISPECIES: hypothetical protein [unclassified Nostoc]MBN3908572.1 hypothetical protein [Nostoc sp. NMS1]MBN3994554.1 hypothetical protein [Nostoc sp. NMS2]